MLINVRCITVCIFNIIYRVTTYIDLLDFYLFIRMLIIWHFLFKVIKDVTYNFIFQCEEP
jgi:hypothetical protein